MWCQRSTSAQWFCAAVRRSDALMHILTKHFGLISFGTCVPEANTCSSGMDATRCM